MLLAGEEIAALDHRPPEPAPRGSAMATVDPDGEHVRIDLEMSGAPASLKARSVAGVALGRGGFGCGRFGDATDAYRAASSGEIVP